MKSVILYVELVLLAMVILAVGGSGVQAAEGEFAVVKVDNPVYNRNELFPAFESYYSPRVKQLRERYNLDAVVAGEEDEWKRILLLRSWIKSKIAINDDNPTRTRGDTFGILDAALKGGAFHCAHFSIVQQGVYNSYGYVTRRLGAGPGLMEKGGHHGINEVWVNKFSKWVLIDAKYDLHFEKDGVPLSALEIRDEIWKDDGKSVVRSFGLKGTTTTDKYKADDFGPTAETYRWCSWETSTNRFTIFPASGGSTLVMYKDDIYDNNTWYRGRKPHWAYNTQFLVATTERNWIYWTPNVITSRANINGNKVNVFLTSFTPNLRSYQLKHDGVWHDCDESVELNLNKDVNEFVFRTMNLYGVSGPEHTVKIAKKN